MVPKIKKFLRSQGSDASHKRESAPYGASKPHLESSGQSARMRDAKTKRGNRFEGGRMRNASAKRGSNRRRTLDSMENYSGKGFECEASLEISDRILAPPSQHPSSRQHRPLSHVSESISHLGLGY